jgi:membrane protein DedA with SNARE-associated domain
MPGTRPGMTVCTMKFAAEGLHLVKPWLKGYGAFAIFLIVYFESFGAPVPGETGVIAAALLASQGELSIVAVFIGVLAGAILGDSTGYLIGRFGGRRVLERFGPYIKLTPERLGRIEDRFHRGGVWLVMIARFLPLLRQLNGLLAGSLAMPLHLFLAANAAGAVLWTSLYVLGPYFFDHLFHLVR